MINKKINQKRRLLELINKIDDLSSSDVTIQQVIELYEHQISEYDEQVEENELELVKQFTNKYLMRYVNDGILGDELQVIHLTTLKPEGYTTEYTRFYKCEGTIIRFSKNSIQMCDWTYGNNLSEEHLKNFQIITKDDFNYYVEQYQQVQRTLKNILK